MYSHLHALVSILKTTSPVIYFYEFSKRKIHHLKDLQEDEFPQKRKESQWKTNSVPSLSVQTASQFVPVQTCKPAGIFFLFGGGCLYELLFAWLLDSFTESKRVKENVKKGERHV